MDGYLVIANAHAGSVEHEALDAAVGVLAAAGPTQVRMSSDPAALDAALTGLDGRVLVVAGGDGSLHLVARLYSGPWRVLRPSSTGAADRPLPQS